MATFKNLIIADETLRGPSQPELLSAVRSAIRDFIKQDETLKGITDENRRQAFFSVVIEYDPTPVEVFQVHFKLPDPDQDELRNRLIQIIRNEDGDVLPGKSWLLTMGGPGPVETLFRKIAEALNTVAYLGDTYTEDPYKQIA